MLAITMIAGLGLPTLAHAATANLRAAEGDVTMPDGVVVHIWGFADCGADPTCAANPAPTLPGPVLEATAGDPLTVHIENDLGVAVSFMLAGQQIDPLIGYGTGVKPAYTTEVAAGGSGDYTFSALRPGTFLYESATDQAKQVQMGLYGALVVRPVGYDAATARTDFGPLTGSDFDREAVLVLSEIDPNWHAAVQAGQPYNAVYFTAKYWLINGKAYPDTADLLANTGDRLLVRLLNAGSEPHVIVSQGQMQSLIGNDGFPVTFPQSRDGSEVSPGETMDVLVTAPAKGVFPIYDRTLDITNADVFPGGMITMLRVLDLADGFNALTTAPTSALSGQNYVYDFLAVDAANLGSTHTYSLVGPPAGMTIDAATGRITWDAASVTGATNTVVVQVNVTDGVGAPVSTQSFSFDLTLDVNQKPVFVAGVTDESIAATTAFSRTVVADDPDLDLLTYTLVGPPVGMAIDNASGVISWTAAASPEGTYTFPVRVHVADGQGGITETSFNLTVVSAAEGSNPGGTLGTAMVTVNVVEVPEGGLTNGATGTPVNDFQFLITEDNTHRYNPADGTCSVMRGGVLYTECSSDESMASYSPVVYAGTVTGGANNMVTLPDGRYFVTAQTINPNAESPNPTQAIRDGGLHKLDGKAFEVVNGAATAVTVEVLADPLPVSRLAIQIFDDMNPLNGQWDRPFEVAPSRLDAHGDPMAERFRVYIEDNLGGQVTTDIHGNPICSQYTMDPALNGADWPGTLVPGTGGVCYTDQNGFLSIENLARGKFGVFALPPEGTDWIQTTTIEGSKVNDVWATEGNAGIWPQETNAFTLHGFVRPCAFGLCGHGGPEVGTGTVSGKVVKVEPSRPPFVVKDGAFTPVDRPWVALNHIGGNGELMALVRGNQNGEFNITGVADGAYEVVVFDDALDFIMAIYTTQVPQLVASAGGGVTENRNIVMYDPRFNTNGLQVLPIPDWWAQLKGTVFLDNNENGVQDAGEPGLPGEAVDVVHRDGSALYATITDEKGEYRIRHFFPFGHWMIPAVGYARLAGTGAHVVAGSHLTMLGEPPVEETTHTGPVLTIGSFGIEGGTNTIDWGKKPYPLTIQDEATNPGQVNGGISGIVFYATTRNEVEAKQAGADPWEPGIAGVELHLHEAIIDPNTGQLVVDPVTGAARSGRLLGIVSADSYTDSPPTECPLDPAYLTDPNFAATLAADPARYHTITNANGDPVLVDANCPEVLRTWNSVRPAVFDGGWQFFQDCRDDATGPNAVFDQGDTACSPLAEGKYIVEVVPPAFYKVVTDNDHNVNYQGDNWRANPAAAPVAPLLYPSGCVGPKYDVTDPEVPSYGKLGDKRPNLCNMKMVEVSKGSNTGTEFFLFTDVPLPARVKGFVNNNLVLENDIARTQFGDKAGVEGVPVSIRDYSGREVVRVYTDRNGFFEAILPSTNTVTVPSPAGMAPNVFNVFANDPGTAQNPDPYFNTNFDTLRMTFEFYPGKTNYADMALTPVNGQLAGQDIVCTPGSLEPKLSYVSQPYGSQADSITIYGSDFGPVGTVRLGGIDLPAGDVTWSNTQITVALANAPVGPGQLELVRHEISGDHVGVNGMTIHVTGAGYNPVFVNVTTTLQAAVNGAPAGAVVLIPGTAAAPTILRDEVVLYNGVSLQGYGPDASKIDGAFMTPIDQLNWTAALATITGSGLADVNGQHPIAQLYSPVLVLGTQGGPGSRVDGLSIQGGRLGGGVHVEAFADNTQISNNRVQNNFGVYTGGIGVGFPNAVDNTLSGIRIHHNVIERNGVEFGGTFNEAGGVGIYGGVTDYRVDHNLFCANGTTIEGGGMVHKTTATGGASIDHNEFLFNWSFTDGGALVVKEPNVVGDSGQLGTGPVTVANNFFQGNVATEDGAAMKFFRTVDAPVVVENNVMVNNIASAQGTVKVQDSLNLVFINNTVAHNVSTSTAGTVLMDPGPHSAGMVVYRNTTAVQQVGAPLHSNPALYNNVFWDNKAYTFVYVPGTTGGNLVERGVFDLSLYLVVGALSEVSNNLFSAQGLAPLPFAQGTTNQLGQDPNFELPYDFALRADVVRSAGEVAVHPLAVPVTITFNEVMQRQGNYHVKSNSPALQYAASSFGGGIVTAPAGDFDGDARPIDGCYDAGADERAKDGTVTQSCIDAVAGTATTVNGQEGVPVHFDGSAFVGTQYQWQFGDGTEATSAQVDKTFANSGQYVVSLDVDGTVVANFIADIANVAPAVTLNGGFDMAGVAGTPIAFIGTASDPSPVDNGSLTFVWNWDVGGSNVTTQSASPSTFHTFAAAGTYTVSLTATDPDGGAGSASITVVVEAAAGGGAVPGDLNGDGVVDLVDYGLLIGAMNAQFGDENYLAAADLVADGQINNLDFQAWMVIYTTP
ncbi:MAG: PKD domain-containing protein [Nitrospirae bacterium]|nr:PKD domain-containing protein [Nitrospirota bacterium]